MLLTRRWVGLTLLLVVVVAACWWLGRWQWRQAQVELVRDPVPGVAALAEVHRPGVAVDPDDVGRRISMIGAFDPTREVTVVDRLSGGELGQWVVTAFEVEGAEGAVIPVVRGWLPSGEEAPAPPDGRQKVIGYLEPSEPDSIRERGRDPLPAGQVELVSSAELISLWGPPLFQGLVLQAVPPSTPPLEVVAPPEPGVTTSWDWQNAAYGVQWWLFGAFAVFWFIRMARTELEDRRAEATDAAGGSLDTMGRSSDGDATKGA